LIFFHTIGIDNFKFNTLRECIKLAAMLKRQLIFGCF